ncbi:hypothetical protein [Halorientalis pallida]|uniref:Uncharacterized protein n=1 Tax=Halorientalis pallida TaxID=2479928 RepID=A0A498KZF9_9EURY|nr:hypothetical protein [Halorientalis pallida]RXK48576.1 hypothetical protein EAF64_12935 [Halorientalis pallida]
MLSAQRLAPLAVALLLVLAGCGAGPSDGTTTAPDETDAPTATDTPASADTPTPGGTETPGTATPDEQSPDDGATSDGGETTAYGVQVRNGTLPFGANRTFTRVRELVGTDVEPPLVTVKNLSEVRQSLAGIDSPTNRALGYEPVSVNWSSPTGATPLNGTVYLHPGEGSPGAVERTLAHEFAHTIQFQADMLPWLGRLPGQGPEVTRDLLQSRLSLIEGGAVYVADAYTDRYLDVRNNTASVRSLYESGSPAYRSAIARYYFGSRYVRNRIDDAGNLSAVYRNYPRTTEGIIHGYTRGEEPKRSLAVETNATAGNWTFARTSTIGEMNTRVTLSTELSRDRAARTATGWGNDRLAVASYTRNRSRLGWVWTFRWDNATEAAEAMPALEDFADARQSASDLEFRTVRISGETTGLVFGDPAFVDAAAVEGTTANVTVQVGS